MNLYYWQSEDFLKLSLRAGRLPHALLFRGMAGIGKGVFTQLLAQGLLCEQPPAPLKACGACEACHWFESGNHPDFRLLQPEAAEPADGADGAEKKKKRDISVAQVRSLGDFINISAHRRGPKVVIIRPAEAMNVNAANALLKSLEEPPPATHFLLVADRPHLLPATVRSRCQQIALTPPTHQQAVQWLEENGVSQPGLALAQAGGAPLLAAELNNPEYWAERQAFLDSLCAREVDPLALAERFSDKPIPQLINWLQRWSYDICMLGAGQPLRYNPDRKEALILAIRRFNNLEIMRFHRELVRFQRIVNHPLNPRLLLEDLLLRYAEIMHN